MMPDVKVIAHSDGIKSGVPDLSVTWNKFTSWWELKFYDDRPFKSPGIQRLTCRKLALNGICRYIIYERRGDMERTNFVRPLDLDLWTTENEWNKGFNHVWVAQKIRAIHLERGDSSYKEVI